MYRPLHRVADWLRDYAPDSDAVDRMAKELQQPREVVLAGITQCAGLIFSDYIKAFGDEYDRESIGQRVADLDEIGAAKPHMMLRIDRDTRIRVDSSTMWGVSPADDEVE